MMNYETKVVLFSSVIVGVGILLVAPNWYIRDGGRKFAEVQGSEDLERIAESATSGNTIKKFEFRMSKYD